MFASTWSRTVSSGIAATSTSVDPHSTSLYTGSAGIKTFVSSPPTSASERPSEFSSPVSSTRKVDSHKMSIIVGCVVGCVLGLILIGLLIYKRHKHLRQQAQLYTHTTDTKSSNTTATVRHWSLRFLPELEGHPLSPRHFPTTSGRPIELDAGTESRPGASTWRGPNVLRAGDCNDQANWGSAPPRYTPTTDRNSHDRQELSTAELDGRPVLPSVKLKALRGTCTTDRPCKV